MKCSFCGRVIEQGTGMTLVKTDGKILNFCSTKCDRNMLKLKRKPRKVSWVRKMQSKEEKKKAEEKNKI